MRLIDADEYGRVLFGWLGEVLEAIDDKAAAVEASAISDCLCQLEEALTIDAVPVVRCKDCRYYHKEHVLCNDGTEKDISEFPQEAFGVFGFVTAEYGITVGGKCEKDTYCGYTVDKSVFRQPNNFCSYGERKDNETD